MATYTFNKFKSTTIYGALNNLDYPDNSVQASCNIQRNLIVGGALTISGTLTSSGIINGNKIYYNGVDISSTYVSNSSLATTLSNYNTYLTPNQLFYNSIGLVATGYVSGGSTHTITNNVGTMTIATSGYPVKINASKLQFSTTGITYYDVLTTNTGALLSGATFTGTAAGLTPATSDNSTTFATTAYVKAQNYGSGGASLSSANTWSNLQNFSYNLGTTPSYQYLGGLTIGQNVSSGLWETDYVANTLNFGSNAGGHRFFVINNGTNPNGLSSASIPTLDITPSQVTACSVLNIKQSTATNSAIFQFLDNTGASRGNIYSSAIGSVFHFDINPDKNTNGYQWMNQNTGAVLMALDVNGNLSTANLIIATQRILK